MSEQVGGTRGRISLWGACSSAEAGKRQAAAGSAEHNPPPQSRRPLQQLSLSPSLPRSLARSLAPSLPPSLPPSISIDKRSAQPCSRRTLSGALRTPGAFWHGGGRQETSKRTSLGARFESCKFEPENDGQVLNRLALPRQSWGSASLLLGSESRRPFGSCPSRQDNNDDNNNPLAVPDAQEPREGGSSLTWFLFLLL